MSKTPKIEVMMHYKRAKPNPYIIEGRCYINSYCYSISDIKRIKQMLSIAGQRVVCPGEVSCHLELEGDITAKNSTYCKIETCLLEKKHIECSSYKNHCNFTAPYLL